MTQAERSPTTHRATAVAISGGPEETPRVMSAALFFFAALPFVDMIVALKLLIIVVWVGAGFSKFGMHFTNVIPPMVSNSPSLPFKWLKRAHYRNFPHDMRPSHLASFMAHIPGTVVEIVAPLALLLSPWPWLTVIAAAIMVCFHLFIISTFPLAVPVEWNVLFGYTTIFLFLGFPNWDGYGIWDMSSPWLTVAILAALLFFPVLATCARIWCRSCRCCGSTRATGRPPCGRSRRAPKRSSTR
jgi:uncharacterized membrane protein YkgB